MSRRDRDDDSMPVKCDCGTWLELYETCDNSKCPGCCLEWCEHGCRYTEESF